MNAREDEPEAAPEATQPSAANAVMRERLRAGGLFLLTSMGVVYTGYAQSTAATRPEKLHEALVFASTLLGILLAHEFGHYVAAKWHGIDVSLPHFIPAPLISPFGTMGAVIRMRSPLSDRRALMDVGAAGPLAGMLFAVPLYAWGSATSQMVKIVPEQGVELGESLIVQGLDRLFHHVPAGYTLMLSPMAFAAWGGMLVTMINLVPVGQLDGGHVLYALLGERLTPYARAIHAGVLLMGVGVAVHAVYTGMPWEQAMQRGGFWMLWFVVLGVLGRVGGGSATGHPPTDALPLGRWREVMGVFTLALFVLLFMPTPIAM